MDQTIDHSVCSLLCINVLQYDVSSLYHVDGWRDSFAVDSSGCRKNIVTKTHQLIHTGTYCFVCLKLLHRIHDRSIYGYLYAFSPFDTIFLPKRILYRAQKIYLGYPLRIRALCANIASCYTGFIYRSTVSNFIYIHRHIQFSTFWSVTGTIQKRLLQKPDKRRHAFYLLRLHGFPVCDSLYLPTQDICKRKNRSIFDTVFAFCKLLFYEIRPCMAWFSGPQLLSVPL